VRQCWLDLFGQFLRAFDKRRNDFLPNACFQGSLNACNDGFRVNLCADVFQDRLEAVDDFVALGLGCPAKFIGPLRVVGDVEIALVDGLREQIDFIPQLGEFRMGALIGFNDRLGHALGVLGVNVEHDEKLGEKLRAVALGEAAIDLPCQFTLFGGIRGQQFLKDVGS